MCNILFQQKYYICVILIETVKLIGKKIFWKMFYE